MLPDNITWSAIIANGAGIPMIALATSFVKDFRLSDRVVRAIMFGFGIALGAIAQHLSGGDWSIGCVKGFVMAGIALGMYHVDGAVSSARKYR